MPRGAGGASMLFGSPIFKKKTPEQQALENTKKSEGIKNAEAFDMAKEIGAAGSQNLSALEDTAMRSAQSRAGQSQLVQQLQGQAAGTAPSLAEAQLKSATSRNLAQQLAAAASGRGGNPAALQRQLAQQQASAGRDLAEKAAETRIQERTAAQGQLGQILGQEQQLVDGLRQRYIAQGFDIATAEKKARQQFEMSKYGADKQAQSAADAASGNVLGSVLGAGASIFGGLLSDENKKKDIKPAKKEVNSFLEQLNAREFKYKNPADLGATAGTRYGIMAQDLEKSKIGKSLVKETSNGKMVDTNQGFAAVLAAQSELHKRVKELEKKGK